MRSSFTSILVLGGMLLLVGGCASMDPAFETRRAHPGIQSAVHPSMTDLPQPQEKIVAAVYQFRDQTGQYKAKERGSSFSRAVTQGATSILIKALKDSKWFRPIERKGLSNLVKERDIIRSIRSQYDRDNSKQLSPLLFAGVILEGGIIGYDTNVITGGGGFRLAAIGGSGEYRQDQVTVYLRAVSTQTGEVLKTVHTTKTIISQKLEGGAFRYVDADLLLETEAGISFNEPPTMAVTEAIEASVRDLIVEGTKDGIFAAKDSVAAKRVIAAHRERKARASRRDYFDRLLARDNRPGVGVSIGGGGVLYQGDYKEPRPHPSGSVGLEYGLTRRWWIGVGGHIGTLEAANAFETTVLSTSLQVTYRFVPYARVTPLLRAEAGVQSEFVEEVRFGDTAFLQGGGSIGLEYMPSRRLGLSASVGAQYSASDDLDGATVGRYHDSIWQADLRLTFYGLGFLVNWIQ